MSTPIAGSLAVTPLYAAPGDVIVAWDDVAATWVQIPAGSGGGGTGTVTSVTAGTGLTGGTITTSGTIALSSPVSVANGGTGASTAPAALANLAGAPLASPVFTGDPRAPTPAPADNDTSIATTAFVKAQGYTTGGTGTVTSIAAGTGITVSPSPITGAGTVSLTVPVTVANGGTGTTTAFTAGSIVFAGAGGIYAQDNANLFWNDANNRLGIGTASPGAPLTVLNDGAQPAYPQAGYVTIDSQGNGKAVSYAAVAYGDSTTYPGFTGVHAGGTRAAPTAIGVNYATMSLQGIGHDGTGFAQGGGLQFFAPATWTSGSHPVQFVLNTIASGSTTQTARLTVTAAGDVGIGTLGPVSKLGVVGASSTPSLSSSVGSLATFTSSDAVQLQFGAISGGSYATWIQAKVDAQNAAYPLCLQPAGGNVGIGTASPGATLAVNGAAGNPTGTWSTVSAREMKQDVIRYERGLDAIVQLNPVMFRYRAGTPFAKSADEPSDLLIGLIADEVEPYVPEIVSEMTATVGEKSDVPVPALMPGLLIFALINSVKTLAEQNAALSARLAALEAA